MQVLPSGLLIPKQQMREHFQLLFYTAPIYAHAIMSSHLSLL